MSTNEKFRISSYLKDIIGRDLVTNEFVAIFELVKNAFDAGATCIDIEFNLEEHKITLVDNGNGMSETDIKDKWLFVAYSDKAEIPSKDYRDKIRPAGQFAGSKGIGRFACDTLGEELELYSKARNEQSIFKLQVDWTRFEKDSVDQFQEIEVTLEATKSFPKTQHAAPLEFGTVLVISKTRQNWDADRIKRLRSDLAKLIDPFGTTTTQASVSTWLVGYENKTQDEISGPIRNKIGDLLEEKTSRISVSISEERILTTLFDRGLKIYEVREPTPYEGFEDIKIKGEIFYLNRSAKSTFTRRMGVAPVKFGSIFLFLNGFRVSPIGDETDDTFGLSQRKQQGVRRYLGTRDVLGRVDVTAPPKRFREVSSRDAGLVEDARSRNLLDAIKNHMVVRLERYVVGVNWKDQLDQERDTPQGLETDSARSRVLEVVGFLARSKDVEVLYYDHDLIRVSEDPDQVTEATLKAMSDLANSSGDTSLFSQIEDAKHRINELKTSREEARAVAKQAIEERTRADAYIAKLEKQATFLGSSLDVNVERVQLLMHQAVIYSGHMRAAIDNAATEVKEILKLADTSNVPEDVEEVLASIRSVSRRVFSSLAGGRWSSDRLKTVLSFSQNIQIDLETDRVSGDLLQFLFEYFEVYTTDASKMPQARFDRSELSLTREFSPVDIAVLIDNLLSNSEKAGAEIINLTVSKKGAKGVILHISDDGFGINNQKIDPSKIFERGYTGHDNGTGLGLYTVQKIIREMDGTIELVGDGTRADFEIFIPGEVN